MALQFNSISQIASKSMQWNLKVRVIRLWIVSNKFKPEIPYSLEMILHYEKMNYFVVAPNNMKFKITIHKHKITFTLNTKVTEIQDPSFHMHIFNIRTFEQLTIHHNVDETELLGNNDMLNSIHYILNFKFTKLLIYFLSIYNSRRKNVYLLAPQNL
ncbi:hypothetical protein R3W88_008061 [Solanum pinnatisectum]|uniref:Replication enhancer protein n=1 Tax=Solanum pinnatisectum TaxID=50273 RepID=A0AAV9M9V9_9SOLN|nr:hypothetical protein R3W88_008061 [Solanum pinnatisectum]